MKHYIPYVAAAYIGTTTGFIVFGASLDIRLYAAFSLCVYMFLWYQRQRPFKYRRWRKLRHNGGSHTGSDWNSVLLRQDFRCAKCRQKVFLTKDHILPVSKGGSDNISNIQGLCTSCNSSKGTKIVDYR